MEEANGALAEEREEKRQALADVAREREKVVELSGEVKVSQNEGCFLYEIQRYSNNCLHMYICRLTRRNY